MAVKTFQTAVGNKRPRRASLFCTFGYDSVAAVTVGTKKKTFVVPFDGRILGIYGHADAAGGGAGATIHDVLKNGTTVFKTATKLTIQTADTGVMDVSPFDPAQCVVRAGDQLRVDVTAVPAVTGHVGVSVTVVIGGP